MEGKAQKITVIIPCHNEESGISSVIRGVPTKLLEKMGFKAEIIVIDNNSNDSTAKVAAQAGARVISETKQGKGNAIRAGFRSVSEDTTYVIMLDGDDTYRAEEIPRLIEPLASGFCDVIVGSRLGGKINKDSLKARNRLANWIFTFLVRFLYNANVTDVLSGYFAWKKDVADELNSYLRSGGFSIEMEMIIKMKRLGYSMYSVPITYDTREGETKLNAFMDGIKITSTLFKYILWSPKRAGKLHSARVHVER
jgi:glycosyltransferase involved in cell wall biosynthesis